MFISLSNVLFSTAFGNTTILNTFTFMLIHVDVVLFQYVYLLHIDTYAKQIGGSKCTLWYCIRLLVMSSKRPGYPELPNNMLYVSHTCECAHRNANRESIC